MNRNFRTQLHRIIERAGLKPWGKPWQNCRSTRETELAETYPLHVVCSWIGNSEAVAAKHYLQVTDNHFELATQSNAKSNAQYDARTTHNPTQPTSAKVGHQCHETRKAPETQGFCHVLADDGLCCTNVRLPILGER